jgi:hypothetical protein
VDPVDPYPDSDLDPQHWFKVLSRFMKNESNLLPVWITVC